MFVEQFSLLQVAVTLIFSVKTRQTLLIAINKKRFERNTKTLHTNEVVKSSETQLHVFIYKTDQF
jgi:hypothetical protein